MVLVFFDLNANICIIHQKTINQDHRGPKICRIIDAILMITNSLQSFIEAILMIAHSIPLFYSRQNIIRIMPPDVVSIIHSLWSEHF